MSEEINFDYKKVKATRGNIYSDNGSLLATDLPFYRVAIDPTLAKDEIFRKGIDSLSIMLSRFYKDRSAKDYKELLKDARATGKQYLTLNRRQINYLTKKEMMRWPILALTHSANTSTHKNAILTLTNMDFLIFMPHLFPSPMERGRVNFYF